MSDKVIHLNASNFDTTISEGKPTLVDFWAPWCGPCKMLGPTIDALAEEVGDWANVCKVNVDDNPDLAQRFAINAIPTIIFFRKGQQQAGVSGISSKDALKAKLEQIK